MADRNITKVYLLNVPLESDYKHTYYFSDAATQYNFFMSKKKAEYDNFSYQRKEGILRIPSQYDELLNKGINYVMYQNAAYSNKWFYAFIKDIKYVNDDRTDLEIETDVIQTWFFDYSVKASFVEREHVLDDKKGLHTFPEQLETGEYIVNSMNHNRKLLVKQAIVAATVDLDSDEFDDLDMQMYGGVYSGVAYYNLAGRQLSGTLKSLAEAGKSDAITSMFMAPSFFPIVSKEGSNKIQESNQAVSYNWDNTYEGDNYNMALTTLNGYIPRNKKLLSYPYCYMLADNSGGANAIYKYELFEDEANTGVCNFKIYATICPSCSIRLVPVNYNGADENYSEGLNLAKLPIASWNTDVYTNWLTQNAVNIGTSIITSASQIIGGGVATIAGAGATGVPMAASGLTGIMGTVGEIYSHSLIPPQAEGNLNGGDVIYGSYGITFRIYNMSIKKEYAKIIDEFFDMYGYKINRVKVPEKNHRPYYWYTKTIDVNIDGAIPNSDMQKIKDCYNSGITFWRHTADIQNYDPDEQDNTLRVN